MLPSASPLCSDQTEMHAVVQSVSPAKFSVDIVSVGLSPAWFELLNWKLVTTSWFQEVSRRWGALPLG